MNYYKSVVFILICRAKHAVQVCGKYKKIMLHKFLPNQKIYNVVTILYYITSVSLNNYI